VKITGRARCRVLAGVIWPVTLAGCSVFGPAPLPSSGPAAVTSSGQGTDATTAQQGGADAASQTLLAQSRDAVAAGNYGQARASIERALRIEPNDPRLWVELGEIELASGNPAQAVAMAQKALSLGSPDPALDARARQLLRDAAR